MSVLNSSGGRGDGGLLHLGGVIYVAVSIYCVVYEVENVALTKLILGNVVRLVASCNNFVSDGVVDLGLSELLSGSLVSSKIAILDFKCLKSCLERCVIEASVRSEIFLSKVEAATACQCEKRHHNGKN